jgi:hypothetical protein
MFLLFLVRSLCGYEDTLLSCLLLCVRLGTLFLVPLITIVCFYAGFTFQWLFFRSLREHVPFLFILVSELVGFPAMYTF